MRKRTPKDQPVTVTGSIHDTEAMCYAEFGRRFGFGSRMLRDLEKAGLRTCLVGRKKVVCGKHALEFFERLANEQAEGDA